MASSPELIEQRKKRMAHARQARLTQQRAKKRAKALEWIKSISSALPPLEEAQKADLATILSGSTGGAE